MRQLRRFGAVEYAKLEWIDWFNHRRLLQLIGNVPPAETKLTKMLPRETSIWQHDP